MKTNIRKLKVNKAQLAVIISKITGDQCNPKKFTKEMLFVKVDTLLKGYKKYTRRLKIAFDIARVKLPRRI